jgi:hypothetical protein
MRILVFWWHSCVLGVLSYCKAIVWCFYRKLEVLKKSKVFVCISSQSEENWCFRFSVEMKAILFIVMFCPYSYPFLIKHLNHSIRVATWICLSILSYQNWPRMFYRSGWLRCDVFISIRVGFWFWLDGMGSVWACVWGSCLSVWR